jgi:hypothetical protein
MSAFDKIMFINTIGVDSAMFGNEMHFITFVAILSSTSGTEGTNFDIRNTVNASIKMFGPHSSANRQIIISVGNTGLAKDNH